MCQKCDTVYRKNDFESVNSKRVCSFIPFPRHPLKCMRKPCDSILFKNVRSASGKFVNAPLKEFYEGCAISHAGS